MPWREWDRGPAGRFMLGRSNIGVRCSRLGQSRRRERNKGWNEHDVRTAAKTAIARTAVAGIARGVG